MAIDVILRRLRYIAAQPTFTEQQVLWAISIEQRASPSLLPWQQSEITYDSADVGAGWT
jgi:hypothetical protein